MFPRAISGSRWRQAAMLVASSGRLVPMAMMVSPMTRSSTFSARAMDTPPETASWAPNASAPMPRNTSTTLIPHARRTPSLR